MVIIATNKIIDVKTPNTIVPPKLENANIINPKKRINDVMKNQWKDSIKIPLTNYVIENIDLEKTKLQVVNLHNQFMLRN